MFADGEDDPEQRACFSRRLVLLGLGQAGALGLIGVRLHQLQVLDADRYAVLAEDNRIGVQALAPIRGRILDRAGRVLADNEAAYRIVLVPSLAGSASEVRRVIDRLQHLTPLTEAESARLIERIRRAPRHSRHVVIGDLSFEEIAKINLLAPSLPGIETEAAGRRRYREGATMGHIVGHVGAHERFALDDEPVLRIPGMRFGKTGIEAGLDERLRGTMGQVRHEVDARGRIMKTLHRVEPQAGRDVMVTIDTDVQRRLQSRLGSERRAALAALDVRTGEVVGLASVPTFDPSDLVGQIQVQARSESDFPMVNRAIRGVYPPGSTFKMVTALAALEAGVVDLEERITCTGRFELGGQTFRCWNRSGHGSCDFHRGLKESCDCYFYEIARRSGIDAIARMAVRLGLGQTYASAGIGQQKAGLIPTPGWKRGRFGRQWLGGETILAAIGQGYVLATPLQLAVMTGRLATGRALLPTFVRPEPGAAPDIPPLLPVRPGHLNAVRRAMTAVVNEAGGTGGRARLDGSSLLIAGKTGTSQVTRRSADRDGELSWHERDHALFVAFAPATDPLYAVAGVIEHGGGGGTVAAPLVRDAIHILFEAPPRSMSSSDAEARGRG